MGGAIAHATANSHNVVIIDTAGRLSVDEAMMAEIGQLKSELNPNEILFVVDSAAGMCLTGAPCAMALVHPAPHYFAQLPLRETRSIYLTPYKT